MEKDGHGRNKYMIQHSQRTNGNVTNESVFLLVHMFHTTMATCLNIFKSCLTRKIFNVK